MNTKISVNSGFENIGKFYKHIRKKEYSHLTPLHQAIYLLLVEQSFGYTKDIKYELQISTKEIMKKVNTKNNKYVLSALQDLQDLKLIQRVEWQDFGPKQAYRYKVLFPDGFSIMHKKIIIEKEPRSKLLEQM